MSNRFFMQTATVALALLMSGCSARMHVTVAVASPQEVRIAALEESTRVECLTLAAKSDQEMKTELWRSLSVLQQAFDDYGTLIQKIAESMTGKSQEKMLSVKAGLTSRPEQLEALVGLDSKLQIDRKIRDLLRASPAANVCASDDPAVARAMASHRELLLKFDADLREMVADLRMQIEARGDEITNSDTKAASVVDAAKTQAAAIQKRANAGLDAACHTFICGSGLGSSEFAYAVASLPPKRWKTVFNEAFAKGTNGNVDIVMKMNERADFTVKGMRFDVSKIPEMARKATTQGLLLAAQIAGVPIPRAPQPPDQNTGLASASLELSGVLDAQAKREAMIAERRRVLLALGLLVASSQSEIKTDMGRARLKEALEAQLSALDALLKLADYPQ